MSTSGAVSAESPSRAAGGLGVDDGFTTRLANTSGLGVAAEFVSKPAPFTCGGIGGAHEFDVFSSELGAGGQRCPAGLVVCALSASAAPAQPPPPRVCDATAACAPLALAAPRGFVSELAPAVGSGIDAGLAFSIAPPPGLANADVFGVTAGFVTKLSPATGYGLDAGLAFSAEPPPRLANTGGPGRWCPLPGRIFALWPRGGQGGNPWGLHLPGCTRPVDADPQSRRRPARRPGV